MEGGSLGEAVGAPSLLPSPLTNSPRETASRSLRVKLAAASCGAPEDPEHSRCFAPSPSVVPHEVGHRHSFLSDMENGCPRSEGEEVVRPTRPPWHPPGLPLTHTQALPLRGSRGQWGQLKACVHIS